MRNMRQSPKSGSAGLSSPLSRALANIRALVDAKTGEPAPSADNGSGTVADLAQRVADLALSVERLEAQNAAMAIENDELNVALLQLSTEKYLAWSAARASAGPGPGAGAGIPDRARDLFTRENDRLVCNGFRPLATGEGSVRIALGGVSSDGRTLDQPSLTLPSAAIDAEGFSGDEPAGRCTLVLGDAPNLPDAAPAEFWTDRRRGKLSGVLLDAADQIDQALADDSGSAPAEAPMWIAFSVFLRALALRARLPILAIGPIGPIPMSGLGEFERSPIVAGGARPFRWVVDASAGFLVLAPSEGTITVQVLAHTLTADQTFTISVNGTPVLDVAFPQGNLEQPTLFVVSVPIGYGAHRLELAVPRFERETGGDRQLHALLEDCRVCWMPADRPDGEAWAPALSLYGAEE